MKKLFGAACIILMTAAIAKAQTYTFKPSGNIAETQVILDNFYGDVRIEGIAGNEIKIEASGYEGIPDKAKGLKPLSATGPDNTGIGLNITQTGNKISMTAASRNANDAEYVIRLPKNIKLKANMESWEASDIEVVGMTNEVEVKSQTGDILLENVTGPIVAHSLASDIQVIFTELNQSSPSSISSTSGDVDVSIPAGTKGTFLMSSISGEVYTDLDFKFADKNALKRMGGGMNASATLNGGGVEISLKSLSGDVFIRKAQ